MIFLTDIKQLEDKFCEIFNFSGFSEIENFIERDFKEEELALLFSEECNLQGKEDQIQDFCEMIFQLRDYTFALSNTLKILLLTKNYDSVFYFMKRVFVGQIGTVKYSSVKEQYNFIERYFDRFIEAVKNCDISTKLYLPLILKAFEAEQNELLYNWKRPAIEFMQNFFNDNKKWTLEYIQLNKDNKYKLFEMICDFNTIDGIKLVVDDFINKEDFDEELNTHILKKYKRETFAEIDKRFQTANYETRKILVEILASFGTDVEAKSRIKDRLEVEDGEEMRLFIAKILGISEDVVTKTEKQFIKKANSTELDVQERSLGLPFDRLHLTFVSGREADDVDYTYLIYLFKQSKELEDLIKLSGYKDVFVKETVEEFADELFKKLMTKDDIKEAKWAIRMCALLSSSEFVKEMCDFNIKLFETKRFKEGKYLLSCLLYSKREEAIEVLKALKEMNLENIDLDAYFKLYMEETEKDKQEVIDDIVGDSTSQEDFEEQANRMFWFYINDKSYSPEYFKERILKHKLFKSIAEKLVWGEYRFNRLYNAFVIRDDEIKYIVKTLDLKDEEIEIKIVHSLDCDERHDILKNAVTEPLFNQFKKAMFNLEDFNTTKVYVNRFCGMLVKVKEYIDNMQDYGFIPNKHYNETMFNSMIHINPDIDLACVVEFERLTSLNAETANLGFVVFYKLSDLMFDNGKYLTTKADAISIGGVGKRYFNFTLSTILDSIKN